MEELTESLATSFAVSSDPNSTAAPHPRFSQYKMKATDSDQDGRRRTILEDQKSRRFNFTNHIRKLTAGSWDSGGSREQKMETSSYRRQPRQYANQLMLSEWLVEVPSDFTEEWLMMVCPFGKRCLVVSSQGSTIAYAKNGYRIGTFPSHLPGGNRKQQAKSKDNCILDCLYSETEKTYYVLDIMSWKDHPVYDSETEFRFFWLQSKFAELPEVSTVAKLNPCKFIMLPSFPCTKEAISEALSSATFEVDGTLFYHKRTHYTLGCTPLVVWLKPYMIPEILDIFVPFKLTEKKPDSYTDYASHLQKVKKNTDEAAKDSSEGSGERRNRRRDRKGAKMEVAGGDADNNAPVDEIEAAEEGKATGDDDTKKEAEQETEGIESIEFNMEVSFDAFAKFGSQNSSNSSSMQ